jgi:YihY family inner membrane protein
MPAGSVGRSLRLTLRYLMETEVHVYAFAVAASVLLSLFPFLNVILSLCRHVLHWNAAVEAVNVAMGDYFPGQLGEFIRYNVSVAVRDHRFQAASLLLLLFVANGVFEPLEVALNRAWGVNTNRSYWRNQIVSLGLIFACGSLALASMIFTALHYSIWPRLLGVRSDALDVMGLFFFKMAAVPLTMLALFLVYWLLPNRKIPPARVIPAAFLVGLALEVLKYVNLFIWPYLKMKLQREYGPFYYSAFLILSSFCAAMLVLAGADWSARRVDSAGDLEAVAPIEGNR